MPSKLSHALNVVYMQDEGFFLAAKDWTWSSSEIQVTYAILD